MAAVFTIDTWKISKLIKVAINYEDSYKKALPMEEHDVVMDYVKLKRES